MAKFTIDITEDNYRFLCEKYGTMPISEKIDLAIRELKAIVLDAGKEPIEMEGINGPFVREMIAKEFKPSEPTEPVEECKHESTYYNSIAKMHYCNSCGVSVSSTQSECNHKDWVVKDGVYCRECNEHLYQLPEECLRAIDNAEKNKPTCYKEKPQAKGEGEE